MLNNITIMGRLTRDPELRITPNGNSVTTFSVAVDRDRDRETTDFLDVVAWRGTAEFIEKYFRKGQLIAVSGSLQTRSWKDKHGNSRTAYEIIADRVYFAGDRRQSDNMPAPDARGGNFSDISGDDDGEIPF